MRNEERFIIIDMDNRHCYIDDVTLEEWKKEIEIMSQKLMKYEQDKKEEYGNDTWAWARSYSSGDKNGHK